MFRGRFERWLDQNLSALPLIKGPETHVAPERLGRTRMDIQWGQRAFLAESVDAYFGILQRGDRTDGQRANMEIVPAADKGAPLGSFGAAIGQASQAGEARIIGVVAAVDSSINIDPMTEPGRV